jgi:hypothetical protein
MSPEEQETKEAYGGPQDGAQLPVTPELMIAIPVSGDHRYAIYDDVGLRYVFRGIEVAEPVCEEEEEEEFSS